MMIGKTILHYHIIEKLGEGGMGVVYKAEDSKLDRFVALKFLPRHLSQSKEEKQRFIHEAKAASALDHPNICTIYEIDETEDGQMFIAMASYDGESVRKKIECGLMAIEEAIDIAIQISRGLAKAHSKQIIHRDIKPENILVTEDGVVKIVDFGLAKLAGRSMLTKEGTTLGTVAYMSPEQTQGTGVDHRTDIWALGTVLYEMLTGEQPFKGDYEQAVMYSIMNEDPKPLTRLGTGVPMQLERLVNKSLAKNSNQRYQNLADMLVDLKSLQGELETGDISRVQRGRKLLWKKKLPLLVPAVAILAAFLYFLPGLHISPTRPATVPSLAILYLKNLGTENDEPYSYGITQDLIIDLAKAGEIRVAPMKDVLSMQEANLSVKKIAEKLRVRYILDGSLKREGDLFKISAQLVEATTGETLWADRLQARASEATLLQGRLAMAIINTLELRPSASLALNLGRSRTTSSEAYEYYLRAKYVFEKRKTKNEAAVARGLFKKAIDLDSTFVSAWIDLGVSYEQAAEYDRAETMYANALAHAKANSDKIGEARALLGLGTLLRLQTDYRNALDYYQQSLYISQELGDRNGKAWALNSIGIMYSFMGRRQEALKHYTKSLAIFHELDDRKQESKLLNNIGIVYDEAGEYSKALDYYGKRIAISQELNEPHPIAYGLANRGGCYLVLGEYSRALDDFIQALAIFRDIGDPMMEGVVTGSLGELYFSVGDTLKAHKNIVKSLEIGESLNDLEAVCDYSVVLGALYDARGERVKALKQYNRGLRVCREIDNVWGEARALEALGEDFFNAGNYRSAAHSLQMADSIYTANGEEPSVLRTASLLALNEAGVGNRVLAENFIKHTEALFDSVEQNSDFRLVYWRLSQAHERLKNRAQQFFYLRKAHASLTEQASRIHDSSMQQSFLVEVKVNREIAAAWKQRKN